MGNLCIEDEDFLPYCDKLTEVDLALETKLADIIAQVKKASSGVSAGDFHDNLVTYTEMLEQIQGKLIDFTSKVQSDATNFLVMMRQKDNEVVV